MTSILERLAIGSKSPWIEESSSGFKREPQRKSHKNKRSKLGCFSHRQPFVVCPRVSGMRGLLI